MRLLPLVAFVAGACSGFQVEPSHGSMFGHFEIAIRGDFGSIGDVRAVSVSGIRAYGVQPADGLVRATVQGAPEPGPARVRVDGTAGSVELDDLFSWDNPVAGIPAKWAAFGASLTQGTISGGIDPDSQLHGVAGAVARAAGVYLGLPLFAPGVFPQMQPSDFEPDCTRKPGAGPGADAFLRMQDPETFQLDLRRGRVDASLQPRNLAVGGSTVDAILHGASGMPAIVEHLVAEPDVAEDRIFTPVSLSQIDRLERLAPDVGFIADLLANDLDKSVTREDDLHEELIPPVAELEPLLAQTMQRLGRLHGQYFVANLPSLTFIPQVADLRARRLAAGADTAGSFDAKAAAIDRRTDECNAALVRAMAPYPNLHLVDFRGQVEAVRTDGADVGGRRLSIVRMGGLLSLDDLHFTHTGYALFANLFVDAVNEVLHAQIPRVDVAAVFAADPLAPERLRAVGLTCPPL